MNHLKILTISALIVSVSSYAHKAEENSHGCHDGKVSYHCHGDPIASSQNTVNRKIIIFPDLMNKPKARKKQILGDNVILWKDDYDNKTINKWLLMTKAVQRNLNKYYDENIPIDGKLNDKMITLIIEFQKYNRMVKDGKMSQGLLDKLIEKNKREKKQRNKLRI